MLMQTWWTKSLPVIAGSGEVSRTLTGQGFESRGVGGRLRLTKRVYLRNNGGRGGKHMKLEIKRTNSKRLQERKRQLVGQLCAGNAPEDRLAQNIEHLRRVATAGEMSLEERALYDELRRVEMLLDE